MEIRFINHASLLVRTDAGQYFLTDPWYLSPAFGGWTQRPSPRVEDVREVLAIPPEKLHVLVSHGHDDHLDEFVVRMHLRGASFFVPKFATPGLARRIERLTGRAPTELGEAPVAAGGAELGCFINPEFTLYDAILTVKADGAALIHANDNWHRYPEALLGKLNARLADVPAQKRAFYVQFGIADCFPLNYPAFDAAQMEEHIRARFAAYREAARANLQGLGLQAGFFYANQSIYPYPAHWKGPALYDLAQAFLRENPVPYRQCTPAPGPALFEHCLRKLEALIEKQAGAEVRLLTSGAQHVPGTVAYEAAPHVWARILTGELTLEAITIGGMGLVHKPPERNISAIHQKVSKLAYFVQSRIAQQGLKFFLED